MQLNVQSLCAEAARFAQFETNAWYHELFSTTDGKAIGSHLELRFKTYLIDLGYQFQEGNAARGLDFPELYVDLKVTSVAQPQSSSPFRSIEQKIYGLGYSLLVFVYEKIDDHANKRSRLNMLDVFFIEAPNTADHRVTAAILNELNYGTNPQSIARVLIDHQITEDQGIAFAMAEQIISRPPRQGCLTITPAFQWRLNYSGPMKQARLNTGEGITPIYRNLSF